MVVQTEKISPAVEQATEKSSFRKALPQILAVGVKNVLLIAFGMTLGYPTILIPNLTSDNPDATFILGQEAISWIGSISLICVPVGCLMSGVLTQPLGRRRAMQFVNIPFIISWLIYYFANDVWQIFLALCLHGLTGGLLEAPVLTYVAEITQPHLRGILCSTSTMTIMIGHLIQFLLATFLDWRTVALYSCIAPLLSFVLLFFVPESPLWLISKNRHADAKRSLAWLRGWTTIEEIEAEYNDICMQVHQQHSNANKPQLTLLELLGKKNFIRPFMLVTFCFFLCHFTGITTLQTYAVQIFATLKSPIDKYYATVILGVVEVLGSITCVILVHFTGKRLLNFVSTISSGICFLIVATYAYTNEINHFQNYAVNITTNWIPMTFLITGAFSSFIGIKILPWILTGELFSNETRAFASGLTAGVGYIFSFISNKIFLLMVSSISLPGTFWMYSAISILGTLVLFFTLPETEGKTLFEIGEHYKGNLKLSNKVRKSSDKIKFGYTNESYVKNDLKDSNV